MVGSLGAQFILNQGLPFLEYPLGFRLPLRNRRALHGHRRLSQQPLPAGSGQGERAAPALTAPISAAASEPSSPPAPLALTWIAYVLWYFSLSSMPNLSLYTKVAMGREPKEFSGLVMALRFGFKSVAGFLLGFLALRRGIRSPVTTTVLLVGAGIAWAWLVPGYGYLLSFGLLGAGELGGAYLPNYVVSISPAAEGARNMSVMALAPLASSVAPTTHGAPHRRVRIRRQLRLCHCHHPGVALAGVPAAPSSDPPNRRAETTEKRVIHEVTRRTTKGHQGVEVNRDGHDLTARSQTELRSPIDPSVLDGRVFEVPMVAIVDVAVHIHHAGQVH